MKLFLWAILLPSLMVTTQLARGFQGGGGEKTKGPATTKSPARNPKASSPSVSPVAQGPNEIQTHLKVCPNPSRPCLREHIFSDNDLTFGLPANLVWQRNYYSESFYAIILKSRPAVIDEDPNSDNCKRGFFPESERRGVQALFPARKVFSSEFGCHMALIAYTNVNFKYNFIAVYAGETQTEAASVLTQVKATGQFQEANIRKMQVVLGYGD
jgi:hypothetical protein